MHLVPNLPGTRHLPDIPALRGLAVLQRMSLDYQMVMLWRTLRKTVDDLFQKLSLHCERRVDLESAVMLKLQKPGLVAWTPRSLEALAERQQVP